MKSIYNEPNGTPQTVQPLALNPDRAAEALDMSKKALWNRTVPRGDIPAIYVGTRVLYPCHLLRRWMNREFVRQQVEATQQVTEQQEEASTDG